MTVRSLFVGLTGLNAMGQGIDVISNNIANVNTVGFRAGRASFDDIFYNTIFAGVGSTDSRGGINPRQLGTGVRVGSIDTNFTQGSTQTTGRLLDMAIQGEGFFVMRDKTGQEFLTRAGNFTLDDEGYIVDPANGFRLVGQVSDEDGNILDTEAPQALSIDMSRQSLAQQTENVSAQGNFDARVGEPNSGQDVQAALSNTNLLGLFDSGGEPVGLVNGDVIQFETGYFELDDPPSDVQSPLDLTEFDGGHGNGILMTVTASTTMDDMERALNDYFTNVINDLSPGSESGLKITFNDRSGNFEFTNTGQNALTGIRIGLEPRPGSSNPPTVANERIGNFFVNEGDPDLTRTLNVDAESDVRTNSMRRADKTTSIDIYDSQGQSHTITVGLAKETLDPAAERTTLLTELKDSEGRNLIPSDVIPAQPVYSDPVIDTATNTAVYTVSQVSNLVATQGVYSFQDGGGNMVSLRLSDGAIAFNGGQFNEPIDATGAVSAEFTTAGIDVTGDAMLNIPSNTNSGGGLLGDAGFSANTTLEDIRKQLEERINAAIRQVAANVSNIDPAASPLLNVPAAGLTAPVDFPSGLNQPVSIRLTDEGSFEFDVARGSLGASTSDDATVTSGLATNADGADKLGLVVDLAAKTRSVRVSTVDPGPSIADRTDDIADGKIDADFNDGGGITGFIQSADPFDPDVAVAFQAGNTDFGLLDSTGDPTVTLAAGGPTGVDDSGVQLVALSSGIYQNSDALTTQRFDSFEAFAAETTTFRALFNKRGYGIASNFDGTPGVDRTTGVPVGVVSSDSDVTPFETNTIRTLGTTRNTVNYQAVLPSDFREPPTNTTGTLLFDSNGRFESYDGDVDPPTISFDPDDSDPENGGVEQISFKLDMSGITQFSSAHTAELETQDGRPVGNLDNVSVAPTGEILGIFTNGDTQTLGKILLGDVNNEGGLIQQGDTLFSVGPNSGSRVFIQPGSEGGTVNSGFLELSNVDLSTEFTNLIVTQRGFSASSRVITTGDQIIQEILALKR